MADYYNTHPGVYHNYPKFPERQVSANSADPDQTAPRGAVWSGSTLFAIPSASFGCITLRKRHPVQLLGWLQQMFWASEYLGSLPIRMFTVHGSRWWSWWSLRKYLPTHCIILWIKETCRVQVATHHRGWFVRVTMTPPVSVATVMFWCVTI